MKRFLLALLMSAKLAPILPINLPSEAKAQTPIDTAIDTYLTDFASHNIHTYRAKRYDLSVFRNYATFKDLHSLDQLTRSNVRDFGAYCCGLGASPATATRRIDNAKHFLNCIMPMCGLPNIADGFVSPRIEAAKPKWFGSDLGREIRAVVADNPRDRLIVELLYRAGLRRSEVCGITINQVDRDSWRLVNVARKANRYQTIAITDSLREAIENYLPYREAWLRRNDPLYAHISADLVNRYPLIVSKYRAEFGIPESYRLSDESVRHLLNKIRKQIGLDKLTAHQLRHAFVRDVYTATNDILLTKQAAGHSDVNTTFRYAGPDEDQVAEAIRKLK